MRVTKSFAIAILFAALLPGDASPDRAADRIGVRYAGPTRLAGTPSLRAVASGPARIVAVTFTLRGRPLASDTTAPFAVDVETRALRAGRATLRTIAVDAAGRRASVATAVTVIPSRRSVHRVRSQAELPSALAALARGHVTVVLSRGTFFAERIRLASGARFIGSGSGTVIRAPADSSYWGIIVAEGRGIRISDLTVDGGGPGAGIGHAVVVQSGSHDVRLSRVRIRDVRKVGVFAWGAYSSVSVQDSQITGGPGASAGVVAGESGTFGTSSDSSVIRTRLANFEDFGILFAHQAHGRTDAARNALALDNDVRNVADPDRAGCVTVPTAAGCGTNEGGIWSGSYGGAIIGNRITNTRWDGIETVGSSTGATVVGNRVSATRTGIYLEHATNHSLIARNAISDVESGILVEWTYGGVSSQFNNFRQNRITRARRVGLLVSIGADGNRIESNTFADSALPAIVLHGSSQNVVRRNRACGVRGRVVAEWVGRHDTGSTATPAGNTIADNAATPRCRTSGR
ncbi:MAG TPA: right-handed parallel beta-helix repeat-containing protein [Gaiellaceae bacterium]|nr:right-handed parallel beta-helix repeat-containing protein [Gaiellaceae bacterium]